MKSISEIKGTLLNTSKTFANILFWIENPEMIIRLANVEKGQIESFYFSGSKTVNAGKMFRVVSSAQYSSLEQLLEEKMNLRTSIDNFMKYFNRYVRTWGNKNGVNFEPKEGEEGNLEKLDLFPITIDNFLWICTLSNKEFNVDLLISDMMSGIDNDLVHYLIKESTLDENLLVEVLKAFPGKVEEYKKGKIGLGNMFFGEYMKRLVDKNIDKDKLRAELIGYIEKMEL